MKLIIILCFFVALKISAQTKYSTVDTVFINFHKNISAAERMYKKDSLMQAYAKFDNAFDNYKGEVNPTHFFNAALCALSIKEEYKALHFLENAIKGGYEIDSSKLADIIFYNQNTKKQYNGSIAKWTNEGIANRNTSWENELYGYYEDNKKYGTPVYKAAFDFCTKCISNPSCSKVTPDFKSKYKMIKDKRKADSLVANDLIKNIKQFGFPDMKLLDKHACGFARSILMNYDSDSKNELLNDVFVKALLAGQISPEYYATVIDRRSLLNGSGMIFYEPNLGYEKTLGKDLLTVNEKRKTIGLYPIVILNASAVKVKEKPKDPKAPKVKEEKSVNGGLYDY
jgi:hypothetical protein